jgi:hypothetical protein
LALARLCDEYYYTQKSVEPFLSSWLGLLLSAALETPSFDWLYTSWVFQLSTLYEAQFQALVCVSSAEDLRALDPNTSVSTDDERDDIKTDEDGSDTSISNDGGPNDIQTDEDGSDDDESVDSEPYDSEATANKLAGKYPRPIPAFLHH